MAIIRGSIRAAATLSFVFWAACAAETPAPEAASTNQPPVPTAAPVVTSMGMQGSTQVKANDPDQAGAHTFVVSKDGAHGTAYMGAEGMLVYIPQPDFAGVDRFEVTVTDNQGVTAATLVSAAVRLAPADASAAADLVTFKNTPGAYVVFAERGVPSGYEISGAPAHGKATIDAQGMLTYRPAEGYAGKDAIDVTLALAGGDATDVTVTVSVVNRAPAPTAAGIHTQSLTAAGTQVSAGDLDPRDTAVFSIATPPKFGAATVNGQGRVTYTPGVASGGDAFVVQVVDGSGAAATTVVQATVYVPATHGYAANGGFTAEVCGDGIDRVLVTAIDPAAQTPLTKATQVTATLAYSVAAATTIGIEDQTGAPITSATVTGCGVVTVSGKLTPPVGSGAQIRPFPGQAQVFSYPFINLFRLAPDGYFTQSLGGPVNDSFVSFDMAMLFAYLSFSVSFDSGFGSRVNFEPAPFVMRVREPNACGRAYRSMTYMNDTMYSESVFAAPNLPPAVSVAPLLTSLPVTAGAVYTVNVDLETCGAPVEVTLTASAAWFSVSATTVTLGNAASVELEVAGAALPASDRLVEGTLTVHAADGSFADIVVPVSAIRFGSLDLADYAPLRLGVQVSDTFDVALPWPFPFEGVTYPTMRVLQGGAVCGSAFESTCAPSPLGPTLGGYDSYAAGTVDGPLFAPYWAYIRATHSVAGELQSGIYYREVTGSADPYVEFLFWDVQTTMNPFAHNVYSLFLYPDGRFTFDYPSVQPTGLEVATWWDLLSAPGFEIGGLDIRSGDTYRFAPVP